MLPSKSQKPLSRLGGGAPKEEKPAKKEPEEQSTEPESEKDEKGDPRWSKEPTFVDQYTKYPGTWRLCPETVAVFDLSIPDQLKAYNDLLARKLPHRAPRVLQVHVDRQFHEGKFIVCFTYHEVEYKKLLS